MPAHDFLHRNAETPLSQHYRAPGFVWSLSTNDEELWEAARACFFPVEEVPTAVDFSARFWIDHGDKAAAPWPNPHVRGVDHLIFAGFDQRSSMLLDLNARRVTGRFSAGMARDRSHWQRIIFPVMLSLLAGSLGTVELHSACVAQGGEGMILMGESQSGKSTLAMALAQMGFDFLADDRTFCSFKEGKLTAWALPRPLKIRQEARVWFDELQQREPTYLPDGEQAFLWEPDGGSTRRPLPECEPKVLIVLERQSSPGFDMAPIAAEEIKNRIEGDLLEESSPARERRLEVIDQLLSLPCRILRYGGPPQSIAAQLATTFHSQDGST